MSIQSHLNIQALQLLPLTHNAILEAPEHSANQISSFALREIMNSRPSLAEMNKKQLNKFDDDLISALKFMNHIP